MFRLSSWQRILTLLLIIMLSGCSTNIEQKQQAPNEIKEVVGFSIYSTDEDYTAGLVDAFMKVMDNEGIGYIIKDANGDPKKQISDVESLVGEKVDAICILPLDEKSIRNSLNEASQSGIPLIAITQIPWVNLSVTISGGDYANGRSAGLAMRNYLNGNGEVIMFDYSSSIGRVKERLNGFMDAVKDSEIKIVDTVQTANTEGTMDSVMELLNKYPNVKGIFASDSFQVIGCGAALKALGRKDIVVTGIGSEMITIDMILDGYVTAVAARDPNEYGGLTAKAAINLLRQSEYQKNYDVSSSIIDKKNAEQMFDYLYKTNYNLKNY